MVKKFSFSTLLSLFVAWLMLPVAAYAGLFDSNPFAEKQGPVDVEQAFVFQPSQQPGGQLKLHWEIPDDYYLYRDRMNIETDAGLQVQSEVKSAAKEKDDPLFGQVFVYKRQADVNLVLTSAGDTPANGVVTVTYQGCWEGGICYPPVTKTVPVNAVPVASAIAPVMAPEPEQAVTAEQAQPAAALQSEQDQFASMLRDRSLLLTLGAFFIAGLALSFTPCVFPMIPILSSIIAGQGASMTTGRALRYSLVYVLSVAVTYTVIGIIAGLFGANLQAAFQAPWVISLFSAVFVLLALSMFGFYDLQIPGSWQTKLSKLSNSQQGGNLLGVAVMGLLSALIVGPCMAAPLAGALIYIGQTGDPVLGGLALFSLSMGMGVPLLLVGASAGRLLPKAGGWMDGVKAFFGVMMLAMAIWMMDRILPTQATMLLAATLLIITAVYMGALDRLPESATGWRKLLKGSGVLGLVYGTVLAVGVFAGSQSFLHPLQGLASGGAAMQEKKLPFNVITTSDQLDVLLAQAQQSGQPVMLDFYADWCISCVELEEFTFKDASVMQALAGFTLIKLDVTSNDEEAKQLYRRFGVIGPPALIFYNRSGMELKNMMLIGNISPQDFNKHVSLIDG